MSLIDGLRYRVQLWLHRDQYERDVDDETGLHLALDARHLLRSLRGSPGFTAVAVLTLALGIGVTTAALSIADHVLVRGLPFRDSGRLMMMLERDQHGAYRTPSAPTAADWQADAGVARALEGLTYIRGDGASLRFGDDSETVGAAYVAPEFFALLGVRPLLGRLLGSDDFPQAVKLQAAADLTTAAREGALRVATGDPLPLNHIAEAHDRVEAGTRERVLLAIPS